MSRRHPIDDLFRDQLEHHSVQPPAGMWERIEEERKRAAVVTTPSRLSGWWWVAAAFIAFLAPLTELADRRPWHDLPVPAPVWAPAPLAEAPTPQPVLTLPTTDAEAAGPVIAANGHDRHSAGAGLTVADSGAEVFALRPALAHIAPEPVSTSTHQLAYDAQPDLSAEAPVLQRMAAFDPLPIRPGYAFGNDRNGAFPSTSQCATFKNMGLRYYLEFNASPDLAFRQILPAADSPEQIAYAQKRNDTERPLYNFSFGARIAASTRFGLVVRTGFDYAQITERIRYLTGTEERFTIINIIGPGGNVIGVDTVYETIEHKHTVQNSYRTLSVPLLAGYELPVKRWLFSAQGGVLLNLLFTQRGSMYLPGSDMPVSFSAISQEGSAAFKSRLGFGWYAGLGAAYRIRHNMYLTAEPHLQAFPTSVTRDDFDTRQNYLSGGLALGLKVQL